MMVGKVALWIVFGGLFYYRHSPIVQWSICRLSEFGQYLAALACFGVKTFAMVGKHVVTLTSQLSPHLLVWLRNITHVVRYHCQQILFGLLGFKSGWVAFLSWTFLLSVLYLYLAHKLRHWWQGGPSRADVNEIDRNAVPIPIGLRNLAGRQNLQNGTDDEENEVVPRRDNHDEVQIPGRQGARRNPAGGDNAAAEVQVQNAAYRLRQAEANRYNRRWQDQRHALETEEDIAAMTRRIEASLDARNCVVCFENEKNTAVFPCGHAQMCRECAHAVQRSTNRCPICQHCIVEIRTVFI